MARIRTIKPEFFASSTIQKLTFAQRLTFLGLLTYVDDEGRGLDDTRLVKAAVWPLDDRHTQRRVSGDLEALEKQGLIQRYEAYDGRKTRRYLHIRGWTEHQRVSHPAPSKHPSPPSLSGELASSSGAAPEDNGKVPEKLQRAPEKLSLEQGTGNREQESLRDTSVSPEKQNASTRQPSDSLGADRFVALYVEHYRGYNHVEPTRERKAQAGRAVKQLLTSGIAPDLIEAAVEIAAEERKPPSAMDLIVADIQAGRNSHGPSP